MKNLWGILLIVSGGGLFVWAVLAFWAGNVSENGVATVANSNPSAFLVALALRLTGGALCLLFGFLQFRRTGKS